MNQNSQGVSWWLKGLLIALGVLAVMPIAAVLYWLYDVDTWEGELRFEVETASEGVFSVRSIPEGAPSEVLQRHVYEYTDATKVPRGTASGDRIVCAIRQTYQNNTDIAQGPKTEVLSCRR